MARNKESAAKASEFILPLKNEDEWKRVICDEIGYQFLTRKVMEAFIRRFRNDDIFGDYLEAATHYYQVAYYNYRVVNKDGEQVDNQTYTHKTLTMVSWENEEQVDKAAAAVKAYKEAQKKYKEAKQKGEKAEEPKPAEYILKFSPLEAKKYFKKVIMPELGAVKAVEKDATTGEELFLERFGETGRKRKSSQQQPKQPKE